MTFLRVLIATIGILGSLWGPVLAAWWLSPWCLCLLVFCIPISIKMFDWGSRA
jgi:hypothetical protein